MKLSKSLIALLCLTATTTAEPWKTHYNKPTTTAWPKELPAYSGVFGVVRNDLTIAVTRYHSPSCDPETKLKHIDHIYSPRCKDFRCPFRALTYDRYKPDGKDHENAMALCQILVFAEQKCRGDAWVLNGTMLDARGKCSGDVQGIFGADKPGKSVRTLCVSGTEEMLPAGRVIGDFTGGQNLGGQ